MRAFYDQSADSLDEPVVTEYPNLGVPFLFTEDPVTVRSPRLALPFCFE